MSAIYEPKGAAREYSPLALNYIRGCDHGCIYCLDGETVLLKNDLSTVRMKNVKIGDILRGVKVGKKGVLRFEKSEVLNKISTFKRVYEIELESGHKVKCSGDHRWYTPKGWKYTFSQKGACLGPRDTIAILQEPMGTFIEDFSFEKIVSITNLGYDDTLFDITTSTETFIANGMVSHNCYVPKMMKRFNKDYVHSNVYIKEEDKLMKEVEASAKKFRNSEKQVFLSFTTDPYSHFNNDTKLTRRVLEILLHYQIPVSILTKGGNNVLQDLDIIKMFGPNIQVGGSLTFTSDADTLNWEKNSTLPAERFDTLKQLHDAGIKTWASIEPVIIPEQSLEILEITKDYVDAYKIGKLNHFPKHEQKFDWTDFLNRAIAICRKNNKAFYIKNDLFEYGDENTFLHAHERDMDHLALKNSFNSLSV